MFSMQSVSLNPLITKFQLSSVASLNLGRSQKRALGNGLNDPEKSRVLKSVWVKQKIMVNSIFYFSHNEFCAIYVKFNMPSICSISKTL